MIEALAFAIAGAGINWIRGGNPWNFIDRNFKRRGWKEPCWKCISLGLTFLVASILLGWKMAGLITLGMAIGQATGFGPELRYLTGLDSKFTVRGWWSRMTAFLIKRTNADRAVWLSATLRGIFWGTAIYIATLGAAPYVIPAAATLPLWYWASSHIFKRDHMWGYAELAFGFVLFGSMAL